MHDLVTCVSMNVKPSVVSVGSGVLCHGGCKLALLFQEQRVKGIVSG